MANAGRLHTFVTPTVNLGTFAANTIKWFGDVIDLQVGYSQYPATRQRIAYGDGGPVYVNFEVTTGFSAGARRIGFVVGSFTDGAFAGSDEHGRVSIRSSAGGTSAAPAGTVVSVMVPPGLVLARYLGVGVVSSGGQSNDTGRFNAWLDVGQGQSNNFYLENYN